MKKTILLFGCILVVSTIAVMAYTTNKTQETHSNNISENTITERNPDLATYKLFPTKNMWTFIKLDTRNGKMWQVQYDVKENNRFETFLNISSLVSDGKETNSRFTLYPTENMYTFILLDQINGKVWQVQWAMEFENRLILPIQ